jgi:hypothetical protein
MDKMRGYTGMCLSRIEHSEPGLLSKEVRAGTGEAGGSRLRNLTQEPGCRCDAIFSSRADAAWPASKVEKSLPSPMQGTEGSQAAAVDEHYLAEMQNNRPAVAQQMSPVGAQGFDLASGNDASFAAHDGDASYLACLP